MDLQIENLSVPLLEDESGVYILPYPIQISENMFLQIHYQTENGSPLTMELRPPFSRQYYLPAGSGRLSSSIPLSTGEELHSFIVDDPALRITSIKLENRSEVEFPSDHLEFLDTQTIEDGLRNISSDHGLFRWSMEPSILVFDFADYQAQARWLKRLAFFVEKPGFRGQILSNAELEGKHGWNAHDYSAQSLADFFNASRDFSLNAEEFQLRKILNDQGIITEIDGEWIPLEGAIISITRESSDLLRHRFFTHEAVHGLFFVNSDFRDAMFQHWETLDEEAQEAWKTFLYYNDHPYDSDFVYLTVNELAAYFLQMPIDEQSEYFRYRYQRVANANPEIAAILEDFLAIRMDFFEANARRIEEILQIYYPLRAGDFNNPESP